MGSWGEYGRWGVKVLAFGVREVVLCHRLVGPGQQGWGVQKESKHRFYVLVCGICDVVFRWGGDSTGVFVSGCKKVDDQVLPGRNVREGESGLGA